MATTFSFLKEKDSRINIFVMGKVNAFLIIMLLVFSNSVIGQNLEAYFSYCTFSSPKQGPYIETYLSLVGNSLVQKKLSDKLRSEVEITMIFKQKDTIIDYKKYILSSPLSADTIKKFPNFIDQQRFSLPGGTYEFEIQIVDQNKKDQPFKHSETIEIVYSDNEIAISDIQLIESYSKTTQQNILTKSGYDLVPYVSNYYPIWLKTITFYAEIYNTSKILGAEEKFLVNYYIEAYENKVILSDFNSFSRKSSGEVSIVFNEFPIEKLASGNYQLVIEARNKNNELLSQKKVFFQRSNSGVELNINDLSSLSTDDSFVTKYNSNDTLSEYIRCLRPISSSLEQTFAENQLKYSDLKLKQQFFLNFWSSRNQLNPEQAWVDYYEKVKKVQQSYSTKIEKGYETDRGRVYLQYGVPNSIDQRLHEPGAYPYEIWHYYNLGKFNNKRFIFYNPALASNDFELLHSDAFGETNNPRWQLILHKRNTQYNNLDEEKMDDHFGGNSDDVFRNPR